MKRYEGKLFGAALGFTFGGPIGALIGTAVGHYFDKSGSGGHARVAKNSEKELHFITSLILLLTGTARADGNVSEAEVQAIRTFFKVQLGYGPLEMRFIERLIFESFQKPVQVAETCAAISARSTYEERLFLLQLNYHVAVSDGALSPQEEEFIRSASASLGIAEYDYLRIKHSFSSSGAAAEGGASGMESAAAFSGVQDPYAVLGLDPGCSDDEVHSAFRSFAKKYHPDSVSHLGREFIELANKRFRQIGKAYERIKEQRGLS